MACYKPLSGFYSAEKTATGKRGLVFKREQSLSGSAVKVPCGRCIGCKIDKAYEWSVRCMHEAKMHEDNCFITLTYDDKHMPQDGSLRPHDLRLFLRKMWKRYDFRYFACGEYGDVTLRPHYHALLFGHSFKDAKRISLSKSKNEQFVSKELSELWTHGIHTIGPCTYETAAYTARYCLKKLTGPLKEQYGGREPEFARMSRMPGLATSYYEKFGKEVRTHDSIIIGGKERKAPRYYDKRFEIVDPAGFLRMKKMRLRKARLYRSDSEPRRMRVRETIAIARLKRKEGSL